MGLLGLVLQRNAKSNRSASDEIEDFAKAKSESPERNIFSNAARFRRRNSLALQDRNQYENWPARVECDYGISFRQGVSSEDKVPNENYFDFYKNWMIKVLLFE